MLTYQFLISTYSERAFDIDYQNLPRTENLSYVVVIQKPCNNIFDINRDDIKIVYTDTIGVAKSRNIALREATSDVVFFMDDDVSFINDKFKKIVNQYENDERLIFATHQINDEFNEPRKKYPNDNTFHTLKSILRYGTVEISLRREFAIQKSISFDERFGAGVYLSACDEPIFLASLLKNKAIGKHFDIPVFFHPKESNGTLSDNKNSIMSRGAMFKVIYGPIISIPLIFAFFIKKSWSYKGSRLDLIKNLFLGYSHV
ncbi:glycosyltransferase [Vibrio vulnificus]|uniref:glycosyltransferase n=1 Tax=Vibrio vulnificus TaxID=672 RepID=UPI0006AD0F9A|nr:glycosyltransferase [Vibrio vulnificus]EGQ9784885.1 glycosyltransferase family 2 protein [Vibrio vulnificus]ELK8439794.1 glycosyltransferase [Vibrio vulnificus]ELK8508824.1 glycosyltransferase [Vibrio vulnificus]ELK8995302.1 glycosyltransferase [Vibrio vulnificus]KOR96139.1 hypothetical protein LO82_20180 [Vibrio vulnificus]